MLSCVGRFLPADSANIYIFSQSMLNWNIISSYLYIKESLSNSFFCNLFAKIKYYLRKEKSK